MRAHMHRFLSRVRGQGGNVNGFVHTETLRVTPREVENRISYAVPGFRTAKKALEASNHVMCRWSSPWVEHVCAILRCEHTYSHQKPSKTHKKGENGFENAIVSLWTGSQAREASNHVI